MTVQEIKDYLEKAIAFFKKDPAETAFQRGYYAGLANTLDFISSTEAEEEEK